MEWLVGELAAVMLFGLVLFAQGRKRSKQDERKAAEAASVQSEEVELAAANTWDLIRSFLHKAGWDYYGIQEQRFSALYTPPERYSGCYRFDEQGNVQVVCNAIQVLEITLNGLLEKELDFQGLGERSQTILVQGLDMQAERVEKR